MKKCLKILNTRYLDYDGKEITIGGVQTYITNLLKVANELDMDVEVFQFANRDFSINYKNALVYGVGVKLSDKLSKNKKILYNYCMQSFNENTDILIYGTDFLVMNTKKPFAMAIQHGIGWDVETTNTHNTISNKIKNKLYPFLQVLRAINIIRYATNSKRLICVDYNYINWYRTQVRQHVSNYRVIPNFTAIPPTNFEKFDTEVIKIIFARRLVTYRGTRIFAEAVDLLLRKHNNIEVTFAGDGPDEAFLKNKFKDDDRVKFITYSSDESLIIHKDKHIAVVPTVGSEGTSLSLLEAMASSCAVICSNVGGMTNIVIDEFNGLMINPEINDLFKALDKLVSDKELAESLAKEAYHTVQKAFSFEVWKNKWKEELQNF